MDDDEESETTRSQGCLIERIAVLDWQRIADELTASGYALLPSIFSQQERQALIASYDNGSQFRSRVVMERHGFGRGEYQYFGYPLPDAVAELRSALYEGLAPIANSWSATMGLDVRYPADHAAYLRRCHRAGQNRPTPLLLKYGEGDYNCLHQDLYGEHVFPMQAVFLLSAPHHDFTGGEFLLAEQRSRMQSRAEVIPLATGDGVIFPVHRRPVQGQRGICRVNVRHGASRVRSGHRYTLGVIFHDAR